MPRTPLIVLATVSAVLGAYIVVRVFRGAPSSQAGVAYIQEDDGSVHLAGEVRPEKRTKPSGNRPKGSEKDWLEEFELTERSGKLVSSNDLKGRPYVVGFFYATCPSVCVRQNEKMKLLQEKFRGQQIRLVEISCDPEVDRPDVLAAYADRFGADKDQWLFFTGEMDYIRRVGSELYMIGVERRGHPEKFALVDATGKIYGYYSWSDPAQWQSLQKDMEKLISEQPKVD